MGLLPVRRDPSGERDFGGIRITTTVRVGYFPAEQRWTTGEFLRATITGATFSKAH